MGLSGLLSIIVIGGLAAGGYYYRDGIKDAFGQTQKSDEEKDLDLRIKEDAFERKKENDDNWDNFWSGGKQSSKQVTKESVSYQNYKQGQDTRTQSEINQWYTKNGVKNPNASNLKTYNKKGISVFQ